MLQNNKEREGKETRVVYIGVRKKLVDYLSFVLCTRSTSCVKSRRQGKQCNRDWRIKKRRQEEVRKRRGEGHQHPTQLIRRRRTCGQNKRPPNGVVTVELCRENDRGRQAKKRAELPFHRQCARHTQCSLR
jgi:hypothetical protein